MSSRRRRSGDFTDSVIEYQGKRVHSQDCQSYENDIQKEDQVISEKKIGGVKVKSNRIISPDSTIYNQVSSLRNRLNSQKQDIDTISRDAKLSKNIEKSIHSGTPASPVNNLLDKMSKVLEISLEKDSKPIVDEEKVNSKKLWNALSTYNRSLIPNKNSVQSHQKVLTRLSQEFHSSPTKFTEKLVTIIEDSVIPANSDRRNCSDVSVSRMTQEFRKLCKFIEDESMPEWVMSPGDEILEEKIENQSIDLVNEESYLENFHKESNASSTPFENKCTEQNKVNLYRETPKGIHRIKDSPKRTPINRIIKESRLNDTNNSFEYWENMCNGVYQRMMPQTLRRSISLPESPATKMSKIQTTCERQMASLDDTIIDQRKFTNRSQYFPDLSPVNTLKSESLQFDAPFKVNAVKNFHDNENPSEEMENIKDIEKSKNTPAKREIILEQCEDNKNQSSSYRDDLDKSLIAEIAQRRQRCFETAKLMMEIDKDDPIHSDGKQTAQLISKLGSPNMSLSLPDDNVDFLSTINHCMEYQSFLLKKRKSLLGILKSSHQSPQANFGSAKKSSSKARNTPLASGTCKTPVSVTKSVEKREQKVARRKFFVTPGSSPSTEQVKKKKEYFPQMEDNISSLRNLSTVKSPRTPEIRRNLYENVKSPVAEYIKSTDAKFVKNVQTKINDWLLTPQNFGVLSDSSRNRITPLKSSEESAALKFKLSPMAKKNIHTQDENTPETEFCLPKIDYKSPAKVYTMKDDSGNERKGQGLRVKALLKSAEKKVVIRHEGRLGMTSPRNVKEGDNNNDTLDTSVHVETVARKTDSIRARNVR